MPLFIPIVPIAIIATCLFLFWIKQMVRLMGLTDDCFPGRYDKVIWAVIVFFGSILGAFVFWLWMQARREEMEITNLAKKVDWTATDLPDVKRNAE